MLLRLSGDWIHSTELVLIVSNSFNSESVLLYIVSTRDIGFVGLSGLLVV